jgi:hypothetical protein
MCAPSVCVREQVSFFFFFPPFLLKETKFDVHLLCVRVHVCTRGGGGNYRKLQVRETLL